MRDFIIASGLVVAFWGLYWIAGPDCFSYINSVDQMTMVCTFGG